MIESINNNLFGGCKMLSKTSKMPSKSISLSAFDCITGEKLSKNKERIKNV